VFPAGPPRQQLGKFAFDFVPLADGTKNGLDSFELRAKCKRPSFGSHSSSLRSVTRHEDDSACEWIIPMLNALTRFVARGAMVW
jgi:hypothetical protein